MTEQQQTPESEQDFSRLWKVLGVSAAIIVGILAVTATIVASNNLWALGLIVAIISIGIIYLCMSLFKPSSKVTEAYVLGEVVTTILEAVFSLFLP